MTAPAPTSTEARVLVRAATVAAGVVVAIVLVAVAVRGLGAGTARGELGFTFGGVPRSVGSAVTIFANNARLLGVTLAAAVVVQLCRLAPDARPLDRRAGRAVAVLCDAVLVLGCVAHVVLVGAALGGYGTRTLSYLLPHGPVELAGFAIGLGVYLEARRAPLRARPALRLAALAVVVLAVAAGLEVFTGA